MISNFLLVVSEYDISAPHSVTYCPCEQYIVQHIYHTFISLFPHFSITWDSFAFTAEIAAECFADCLFFFFSCMRSADMRTCTFVIRWETRLACAVKEQEVVMTNGTIRVPETGVILYLGDLYFRWEQH